MTCSNVRSMTNVNNSRLPGQVISATADNPNGLLILLDGEGGDGNRGSAPSYVQWGGPLAGFGKRKWYRAETPGPFRSCSPAIPSLSSNTPVPTPPPLPYKVLGIGVGVMWQMGRS